MQAFVQASGVWRIVTGTITRPATDIDAQNAWDISDDTAIGNITLRLSQTIRNQVGATSAATWANLQNTFGSVGVSRIYGDFKALVSFKISGTQNPSAEMERFSMHQQRLVAHNVVIPDNIVGMMLLAALPACWDHVSAIYLQGKTNITAVTSAGVRQAIVAEFDRTNSGDRQQAHKISAIKRKGEHPSWKGKAPANKSSTADDEPRPSSHKKKVRRSQKGKGKHAHVAERSPSPNPFT